MVCLSGILRGIPLGLWDGSVAALEVRAKKLSQGLVPAVATVIFTSPPDTDTEIEGMFIANTTVGAKTITIYDGGIAAGNVLLEINLPSKGNFTVDTTVALSPGGTIAALASAASSVNVTIYGRETKRL